MARRKKPPTPKQRASAVRNLIKARLRLRYRSRSQSIAADRKRVLEAKGITTGRKIRRRRR